MKICELLIQLETHVNEENIKLYNVIDIEVGKIDGLYCAKYKDMRCYNKSIKEATTHLLKMILRGI